MSRSALLTGVTGFIGGNLARRLLASGWTVHALVRASSDTAALPGDIRLHVRDDGAGPLTEIVAAAAPDVVFHLASLYLADHKPEQVGGLVASNILLPALLAEAMTAAGATRLVDTGTAWQHFGGGGYDPVNLYAATKQACQDVLRYYHAARGLSVVTLKLFDTYGAGDTRRKLVQLLVDAAESGEPLGMSPGEQIIDLTHVADVVDAFVAAGDRLLSSETAIDEEYLVSGDRINVRDLADLVGRALDKPIDARFGARPYRAREMMVPPQATLALPGWHRQRKLADALHTLVETKG